MAEICEAPDFAWYSHDREGRPIDPHRYAITIVIDQGFETMEGPSGDDWISSSQSRRAYLRGAHIASRECPCAAIPFGPKIMFNGYETWKPDVEKCARYCLRNHRGSACGRCMKECPFTTEGLLTHRLWLWIAMRFPWLRGWLARMDDVLGHGRQNPVKKWWFDLELVDGIAIRPERPTSEISTSIGVKSSPQPRRSRCTRPNSTRRRTRTDPSSQTVAQLSSTPTGHSSPSTHRDEAECLGGRNAA